MSFGEICSVVGIPTIIAFIFQILFTRFYNKKRAENDENASLKAGVQALLRDRLIERYEVYKKQGWVSVQDKDNYENMYKRYHELGQNGVMDACHEYVLNLPTEKPIKKTTKTKENK